MSKREDILDGRLRSNWMKKYWLLYTCNAGWLDLGHLDPNNTRPEIGAANLWKSLSSLKTFKKLRVGLGLLTVGIARKI